MIRHMNHRSNEIALLQAEARALCMSYLEGKPRLGSILKDTLCPIFSFFPFSENWKWLQRAEQLDFGQSAPEV